MFVPEDYNFVFAHIKGSDYNEKIKNMSNWFSYWLKFKALCAEYGTVVFDIDDTLIDKEENIIPDIFSVYKSCIKLGFVVNIVTARPESKMNRTLTMQMLHKNGIDKFEALYMMPSDINPTFETISQYKYLARQDISKRHNIIANCGDMWSDHVKYPCTKSKKLKVFNDRESIEAVICFLPGNTFPCVKMPSPKS